MTGTKFYERREIKDALSYIKASINRDSLTDIKRTINTPTRGIGKTTMLKVLENKTPELPLSAQNKVGEYFKILDSIKEKISNEVPSVVVKYTIIVEILYKIIKINKE
jgi:superfamily I DNA/RNA helicase